MATIGVFLETLHIFRGLCVLEAWKGKKPEYSTRQCVVALVIVLFSLIQFQTKPSPPSLTLADRQSYQGHFCRLVWCGG